MVPATDNSVNTAARNDEKIIFIALVALAVLVSLGCWMAATALSRRDELHGIALDKPRRLVDFSLTDRTGRTVTRAELDGKILAISFLFTGCAATCPEVSERMAEIQRLTAKQPDVQLVSFTVDPRSDTPPVLAKWGAHYSADTNRWLLLTGSKPMLKDLIGTSFLNTDINDPFNSMPCNFVGTERIAVVDKHGRVRIFFNGLRAETPAAVAEEINLLRNEN